LESSFFSNRGRGAASPPWVVEPLPRKGSWGVVRPPQFSPAPHGLREGPSWVWPWSSPSCLPGPSSLNPFSWMVFSRPHRPPSSRACPEALGRRLAIQVGVEGIRHRQGLPRESLAATEDSVLVRPASHPISRLFPAVSFRRDTQQSGAGGGALVCGGPARFLTGLVRTGITVHGRD